MAYTCWSRRPGTKSWQVHYHVADRHQATIVGRWPDLGVDEAKAKRDEIKRTVRAGDDPAHDRREQRGARIEANATTVRVVAERWIETASEARGWSANYTAQTTQRIANHVLPVLGDRPIGRVTTHEIEALLGDLLKRLRSQAVHVRQHLQLLFDYALRRKMVTENSGARDRRGPYRSASPAIPAKSAKRMSRPSAKRGPSSRRSRRPPARRSPSSHTG